ncbi:MAG: hypothetical protein ACD_30C00002G0037 [uncultured bacterium]|uniref:Phage shock protein C, PspC n=4 Tax=Candidatus Daviesiibacteriota TaxID=1752718 RepID=A0A0G0I2U1_9BACT|nr:MAG: hypothetical protein ACD_30C00002G0037 [uncultured bacterium]KKQ10431.1 MAG: Phage shock protein C, PspC [Candidatus Daviesbacteria bacterium GW2011_GWB1_36_5]KKQ13617.1 MAG: Phage shock protein C, PspC [Candidatus Daviesbacteria bacterium GW2011_GWA1_36_8]OGE16590.1 MAG: hypothetical protein A2858_01960 [Candidatus Daviesbacteria bacterium RIFCSPHIGHO2_01_FULL_36_37]OGE31729.1 MAG: hypothetical protein A3C99_02845 [Candidatus Daviesbacteria bacterium RIFCSPHIGHO2_02_FULL_37_9]OGE34673
MPTKEKPNNLNSQRLHRSETNKIIAGVAGGIGEFFDIDPTIIRIIFVLLTIFGGSGILIYFILWIVMPSSTNTSEITKDTLKENLQDLKNTTQKFTHTISRPTTKDDSKFWWALFIIILGFLFLFNNLGIFQFQEFGRFWPVLLVLLGLSILLRS